MQAKSLFDCSLVQEELGTQEYSFAERMRKKGTLSENYEEYGQQVVYCTLLISEIKLPNIRFVYELVRHSARYLDGLEGKRKRKNVLKSSPLTSVEVA